MSRRQPVRRTTLALAALLAIGAVPDQRAEAAVCNWIPVSGNWATLGNWSCGAVPGAADTASLSIGQTATVTGGQGPTNLGNAGTVSINDNSTLSLLGINVNTGTINLGSVGNLTQINFSGITQLNGNGNVTFSNTQANRVVGDGATLTLGAGQTLQGAASIGGGGNFGLVNNGSLVANSTNGMTLNTSVAVTNNNLLRGDGASLLIQNTTVNQGAGGVLSAINGGVVRLQNSTINGGSFVTAGGGTIAHRTAAAIRWRA